MVAVGFAGSILVVHEVPRHGTGWATLVPLIVAGLGSGLVIAPNQSLTLSEVPVPRAGTAGGLLQTGQRIGAAVGIAAVGAAFFARLAASHGNFASSFQRGILVALAFVLAALVLAAVYILVDRRRAGREPGPTMADEADREPAYVGRHEARQR
jgi:MFS family permease